MAKEPEREAKPLSLAGHSGCVPLALGPPPVYSRSGPVRLGPPWLVGGPVVRFGVRGSCHCDPSVGCWRHHTRPQLSEAGIVVWMASGLAINPRTEEQSRNRHLPRLPGGPFSYKSHRRTGLSPHNSLRTSPWMGVGTYVLCTKLLLYAFSTLYVAQRGSHPWFMMESSSSHGCVVGYVDLRPPTKTNLQVCRVWALISSVDGGLIKQRSSPRRGLLGVALVPLVLAFMFNLGPRLIWDTSTFRLYLEEVEYTREQDKGGCN